MVPRIKIGSAGNYFQARVRRGMFNITRRSYSRKQQGSIISGPPAGAGVAASSCSRVLIAGGIVPELTCFIIVFFHQGYHMNENFAGGLQVRRRRLR